MYVVSVTPDTQFEKRAPNSFNIPPNPSPSGGQASWYEWRYVNSAFIKTYYGVGVSDNAPVLTPAIGETAVRNGSNWTMKSGYGLSLSLSNAMASVSGYVMPASSAYTLPQYAYALLPEYRYEQLLSKYRTLSLFDGRFEFPENVTYGKVHFTPLWYSNGRYIISVVQTDCWTPAGMITRKSVTNTVTVTDAAYDDWFLGR